ncbi:uncharacterized protein BJX67DRAFT_344232 [Aspergillus lucknowensis]|uniref:Uncharacterized protein n=1 Tax=Aspergillus lucknowensis TaxID=176173 RepID=A0ABR4M1D0_9EURO
MGASLFKSLLFLLTLALALLQPGACGPSASHDLMMSSDLFLTTWTEPDCQGKQTWKKFSQGSRGLVVPKYVVSRSLTLSRLLAPYEQLDISVTPNLDTWSGDWGNAEHESSCEVFVRSFLPGNVTMDCYNVPAFTCEHLWLNPSLGGRY